ncbi:MAG: capsid cement protein [Acidobacteriota bacterium]
MALKLEQQPGITVTRTANAALASPYRFVMPISGTPENVKQVDAANAEALGLIDQKYNQGDPVKVILGGIAIVEAGAAVAVDDKIVTDASGRGVPKGSTATTHYKVQGKALSAASAAGELFAMEVAKHDFYQA